MKNKIYIYIKIILKLIAILLFSFTFWYFVFSFICADFNIFNWHWFNRIIYLLLSFFTFGKILEEQNKL